MHDVKPGVYEHYKKKEYRVIGVFKHSETLEDYVAYECLHENETAQWWIRPLKMFCENVEVEGGVIPRFRFVRELP